MKKAFYYCILFMLLLVAVIGIFSEPDPALDIPRWFTVFAVTKGAGFAAGYAACRLATRLGKQGKIRLSDDDEV